MSRDRSDNPNAGVRALAFYLPQFHPIPENDAWWGPGFTEWSNVVRARPLFDGHYQPHLPADLGFYDLRLAEVREVQAALARAHGISGFVYHHYWFGGRRVLERPFDEVLRSGRPDFPFALCWANENWTRRWDGRSRELLVQQDYGDDELEEHATWLARAFSDPRYIEVGGRPLLIVYKSQGFPGEPGDYLKRLKQACVAHGSAEPYVVQVEAHTTDREPAENGCDAEVEFHPHRLWELAPNLAVDDRRFGDNYVFDYRALIEGHSRREAPPWTRYPCVVPSWDNTPRMGGELPSTVLLGSEPELYERWLRDVAQREADRDGEGLVFINAWNEWAESTHLEPDMRYGRAYLEATRAVFGAHDAEASSVASTGDVEWDPVTAYQELRERYLNAQRSREQDVRAGQLAAEAAIADLERELATYKQAANDLERWAHNERRVRVEAEEWARNEQRVREEFEAAFAAGDGAARDRGAVGPRLRRPLRSAARRLRAVARGPGPDVAAPPVIESPEEVESADVELEARVVWIFGAPRSGTTWLTQLLVHPWELSGTSPTALSPPRRRWLDPPDAITINEPYLGEHLMPWNPHLSDRAGDGLNGNGTANGDGANGDGDIRIHRNWSSGDLATGDRTINSRHVGRPSYVFSDEYEDEWRPALRRFILDRVAAQVQRARDLHGARDPLIVIKEPRGAHAAPLLMSLLPRSRMIWLMRDGRDVIDSWLHAHLEGSFLAGYERPAVTADQRLEFVKREANDWLYRVRGLEAAFEQHPDELRRRLRYEDLRADTAAVMRDAFAWLELNRSEEALEVTVAENAFERIEMDQIGPQKFHRAAKVGHWRENLSADEQQALEEILGQRLRELGYEASVTV